MLKTFQRSIIKSGLSVLGLPIPAEAAQQSKLESNIKQQSEDFTEMTPSNTKR